jgi:hypothetical protein
MNDETVRMKSSFEEEVVQRLTVVEEKVGRIDWDSFRIDWDSFRRDFVRHNSEVKEMFGLLNRKFDVINHELLDIKAEQIRLDRRIDKIELDIRPQ